MVGPQVEWGDTEHLLAAAVDALHLNVWLQTDTKKNARPEPLTRPGEAEAKRKKADELAARLLAQRERVGR